MQHPTDAQMGYDACANAQIPCTDPSLLQGNVGAGIGATVGKICGMERADKSGIGIHAVSIGPLKIAAIVVLNALGDIFNPETGQKIAGLHNEDRSDYVDTRDILYQMFTLRTSLLEKKSPVIRSPFLLLIQPLAQLLPTEIFLKQNFANWHP